MTPTAPRDIVDGWAGQVQAVSHLAAKIAGSPFIPAGLRGSDTAVTAAILAGRELGVGPMTALQHFHVVDGRVGMSAQLMRALVFAHGHTIRVVELNNARCALIGRRAGDSHDSPEVVWTITDARQAGLTGRPNWQRYPRAMLFARCTVELCRALFPDVIGGMSYASEELDDLANAPAAAPAEAGTSRTVRRGRTTAELPAVDPRPPDPATVAAGDAPPLPGDQDAQPPAPAQNSTDTAEPAPAAPTPRDQDEDLSDAQRAHLFVLLGEAERMTPRDERLRVLSGLTRRRLSSASELTRAEASRAIDALVFAAESNDPAALDALVDAGWEAIAEREQPALWEDTTADDDTDMPQGDYE
jgi:hypothetical protein